MELMFEYWKQNWKTKVLRTINTLWCSVPPGFPAHYAIEVDACCLACCCAVVLSLQIRSRDPYVMFQISLSLFNQMRQLTRKCKKMLFEKKDCSGNCPFKTEYFFVISRTHCSYILLLCIILVIFTQHEDVVEELTKQKSSVFDYLTGCPFLMSAVLLGRAEEGFKGYLDHEWYNKEGEEPNDRDQARRQEYHKWGCHKWTVWGTVHCIAPAYISEYMVFVYFRGGSCLSHGCCTMECARRFLSIVSNGINSCWALLIRWFINKGLLINQWTNHIISHVIMWSITWWEPASRLVLPD